MALRSELGCAAYYAGQFEQSAQFYLNVKADAPENVGVYWGLGRAYNQLGDHDEAIKQLEIGKTKLGGDWDGLIAELAYGYAKRGDTGTALKLLRELEQRELDGAYVDPYAIAMIHVALRESAMNELDKTEHTKKTFERLIQACNIKSPWLPSLIVAPKFASLRDHEEFQRILNDVLKFPK